MFKSFVFFFQCKTKLSRGVKRIAFGPPPQGEQNKEEIDSSEDMQCNIVTFVLKGFCFL